MRFLAAAVAMLALTWSISSAADDTATKQIVFVCEHGNVKSLMAASYFNQLVAQRRLPFHAISRGTAPDSATVPAPIVAGLQADGVDVSSFRPAAVDSVDVANAVRVVAISTQLPSKVRIDAPQIEQWNDVPAASSDYAAARAAIKAHVAELIERLQHSQQRN
jgi:protein-tyrosine-phosphatase